MAIPQPKTLSYQTFSSAPKLSLETQCKEAGVEIASGREFADHLYCRTCVREGKVSFTCSGCGESRPSGQVKVSIGSMSPDMICKDCYRTMTAEVWFKLVEDLEDNHAWDDE
jgi:hypothetical protein